MQIVLRYAVLALIAFALHLIWEKLHIPLYTNYEALGTGWKLAIWATCGDVLYTVLIALAVAALFGRLDWFVGASLRQYAFAAALGLGVALFVEYKALYLHTWGYDAAMPIIPVLHVGLSPILQMLILTPLALLIAGAL